MSDHLVSLNEIKKIDDFFDRGYVVQYVYENLSGMFAEFERQEEEVCLQVLTAAGRKYFAARLQEQGLRKL